MILSVSQEIGTTSEALQGGGEVIPDVLPAIAHLLSVAAVVIAMCRRAQKPDPDVGDRYDVEVVAGE
jgi:hypothetical protein